MDGMEICIYMYSLRKHYGPKQTTIQATVNQGVKRSLIIPQD